MPRQRVILVVEDDPAIRRGLKDALGFSGYAVVECAEGTSAVERASTSGADLVLLDVMLPGMDGFSILQDLRRLRPTLPVIMVTARGAEEDRVRGLAGGSDDYIVKPFSARELLARVDAVLRRSAERPSEAHEIRFGGLRIDLDRSEARTESGTPQTLSEKEREIARALAANRTRTLSREELLRLVWGLDPKGLDTRAVDMQVARLRSRLAQAGAEGELVETVRGSGYRLHADAEVLSR